MVLSVWMVVLMSNKLFGLFIIFILAISPCASATRSFSLTDTHKISNIDSTVKSYNSDETLNYDEMLHFLTRGKNIPEYMLMVGSGTNYSKYTFIKSDKIPDGFHNVSNNYNDLDFKDDTWRSTIFHQPHVQLPCTFLINNTNQVDLYNYWCFTYDIGNTQHYSYDAIYFEEYKFPYPLDDNCSTLNKSIEKDPMGTCDIIEDWSQEMNKELTKGLTAIETESSSSRGQNILISKIRGEPGNYYWLPDTYGGYYENVNDDGLEVINWVEQGMKAVFGDARSQLGTVILILQTINLGLEHIKMIAGSIPFLDCLKTPIEITMLINKDYINILQWKLNNLNSIYWQYDKDTMLISGEKSYRSGILKGTIKPEEPTDDSKRIMNANIDKCISIIETNLNTQHELIYNASYREKIINNLNYKIDYYDSLLDFFEHNDNADKSKIPEITERRDKAIKNKDNFVNQFKNLDISKLVYEKYASYQNKLIEGLEESKCKV